MGLGKNWTKEEITYLEDKWGTVSLPSIAKRLNRTETAVILRVSRMGLGAFLQNGDYVTWNQFLLALGIKCSSTYKTISWIQNRGFPVKNKKVGQCTFKVVYIEQFWKWADKNRSFLDFSKFAPYALGPEPEWAKEKRQMDIENSKKYKTTPWTSSEDAELVGYLRRYKYGYAELSKRLRRTAGAIQTRIIELGIKDRPIKADNHNPWTEQEKEQLKEFIIKGYSYEMISELLQGDVVRSAKAIRGYLGRVYGTEVLDRVRTIILEEESEE